MCKLLIICSNPAVSAQHFANILWCAVGKPKVMIFNKSVAKLYLVQVIAKIQF